MPFQHDAMTKNGVFYMALTVLVQVNNKTLTAQSSQNKQRCNTHVLVRPKTISLKVYFFL